MIFLKRGVFIPPGCRCCSDHIVGKQMTIESFGQICVSHADHWTLDSVGFQELLADVCSLLHCPKSFDFDDSTSLNEDAYKTVVGLTKGIPFRK